MTTLMRYDPFREALRLRDAMEQRFDTVVIGGGQSGLAVGYYLARQGRDFVILDANDRIGASWRKRWDSLKLFTPARYSSLPGMPLPAPADAFLTKDEVADYLEAYVARFHLPVRLDIGFVKNGNGQPIAQPVPVVPNRPCSRGESRVTKK